MIQKYLPEQKQMTKIQAHVDRNLADKVKVLMRGHGYTWNEVIQACLMHFVDDLNGYSVEIAPLKDCNEKE